MVKCEVCGEKVTGQMAASKSMVNYHFDCYLEKIKGDTKLDIGGEEVENSKY
jgi:hypothetical protein